MAKGKIDLKSREYQEEQLLQACDSIVMFEGESAFYQQKPGPSAEQIVQMAWNAYVGMELYFLTGNLDAYKEIKPEDYPDYLLTLDDARPILMTEEGYAEYLTSQAQ